MLSTRRIREFVMEEIRVWEGSIIGIYIGVSASQQHIYTQTVQYEGFG
jgi:hypothetical protein